MCFALSRETIAVFSCCVPQLGSLGFCNFVTLVVFVYELCIVARFLTSLDNLVTSKSLSSRKPICGLLLVLYHFGWILLWCVLALALLRYYLSVVEGLCAFCVHSDHNH